MAQDHRWNNLEDVRRAKSALGTALLAGGAIATAYGADQEEGEAALAGIGAMALGLLTKAGARADTRYCEFMPQAVYLVPLSLGRPTDVDVEIAGRPQARIHLNNVRPGTQRDPLVIYLRLFRDGGGGDVSWLTARREVYSNDITGIGRGPAAYPWILGGRDVSTPSRAALDAYQAAGALQDCTVAELLDLYASEGLVIGSGMENRRDVPKDPSFRHVLEGGSGLFTPHAHSMGYQRIMCSRQPAYRPRTELVRKAADTMRVLQQEQRVAAADDGAAAASHQQEPAEQ
jgi:hypothetical protein